MKLTPYTEPKEAGKEMHSLAARLFPITRSLTGAGVRETLDILGEHIPLKRFEVPTGTQAFDWKVPKEWNIKDAFITDESGKKIVDMKTNNLHVVGYSIPVDEEISLEELQKHLYSLSEQPDAIPYVTSYYVERWGFCMTQRQRDGLKPGKYRVRIDSALTEGNLTYAEYVIPGKSKKEIFISTYFCHPSMANNELSGPVVATYLAKWLASMPRKYTYRFVFIPETIGSLVYLSKHITVFKENVIAGFNLTCMGDERTFSYLPSRYGNTLADKVALRVLKERYPKFVTYSFLDRGSDERQYCSPGADLPVVTIMRSKYGVYPEYHTSLDDLSLVTPKGLEGSYEMLKAAILMLEERVVYQSTYVGEPQLGKRGLYPTVSQKGNIDNSVKYMLDFLAYADGTNDMATISETLGVPVAELEPIAEKLIGAGLLKTSSD